MPNRFANGTSVINSATATTAAKAYLGFRLYNGTAAAILVKVYDGTSAAGVLLDPIALAAGESAREYTPLPLASGSIFVDWQGAQGVVLYAVE